MKIQSLNGAWKLWAVGDGLQHDVTVPGSVYSAFLADGTMPDPYYRENERAAFDLLRKDYEFERKFEVSEELLACNRVVLRCFGLDTLAHICVNGKDVGHADNMHITWGFDVKDVLVPGENTIRIRFNSPIEYVLGEAEKRPMWGSTDAIPGFGHLRKAHCMFGWDWGPRLPDAGIWRDIQLEGIDVARLESVLVEQFHEDGKVTLKLTPNIEGDADACCLEAELIAPNGETIAFDNGEAVVEQPELWWPHGYGAQPLYTIKARLVANGVEQDVWERRIGLRTLTMHREKDEWGEQFCHMVNGVKVFAMGADYIPEDNILSRMNPERTRRLLEDAVLANHNSIRVWGGGFYPGDEFYDICDELGLMVWQDLMYACSFYDLTPEFDASIRLETVQNVRRLRHHASLALICGNNEMEDFMGWANVALTKGMDSYDGQAVRRSHVSDYLKMYSYILPAIVKEEAPQTFWWPSSPSSGGDFEYPQDPSRGDVHYWQVWHGEKPFTEYRKFQFRYVSEFGFQSFPSLATVESFTEPGDRNIFSRIMERHQRNAAANGKILNYLSQTFRYPYSFDNLLYASQLLQAEAIRYGVEHWRRNRGQSMGAIVWQLNDIWPVASWASIDYYGRWKALHYSEKRFFAPILVSIEEQGELSQNPKINEWHPAPIEKSARLNVSNETREDVTVTLHCALRSADGKAILEGEQTLTVPALSSVWGEKLDFADAASLTGSYVSVDMYKDGEWIGSNTALFCAPKHFEFIDPHLTAEVDGDTITVKADAYARSVCVESEDPDLLLDDNYFDMNGGERTIRVLRGTAKNVRVRSVWDIDK